MCSCFSHLLEAMRLIEEVAIATSVDDLKTSRPITGQLFPNLEMFDAKIAAALRKIIRNSNFRQKAHLEDQKAHVAEDGSLL